MDITTYLEPVEISNFEHYDNLNSKRLGDIIKSYTKQDIFPDIEDIDIALIGINEDRKAVNNKGCALAPKYIRDKLYKLYPGDYSIKIADIGNIKKGFTIKDTYFAVSFVIAELIKNNILPVIIGGSQDLTYANYRAYENLGQIINIVQVDPCFDLGTTEQEIDSHSYLSKIILHQPNYLFNYTNIGYQTYFVDPKAIELMKNLYFDTHRLGIVRTDIKEIEPIIRNADMLSFDISAIKQSDAPGNKNASANGFYGEEACKIVRYAGISDKLTSIGFYEMNPDIDKQEQTSNLLAQMIWYFIDGYYNRKNDFPYKEKDNYIKYLVTFKNHQHEIIFYKSKKSNRWWMEIPCPVNLKLKYKRHYLISCSYNDYQTACKQEIPDRWWKGYQKLM